jgi:4-hydroxyproline epimerase
VAWGGNWFFLVPNSPIELKAANIEELTNYTWRIRRALRENGITGNDGQEIDHIELFGPPERSDANAKNFVLCPGRAYDRSPCGTGTSAKLACMVADGRFSPGQVWRQESIIGSLFEGRVEINGGEIYPLITGTAHVNAESKLVLDERDPFCWGIPA